MKKMLSVALLALLFACLYWACDKAEQEPLQTTPTSVPEVDISNLTDGAVGENTLLEDRHSCDVGECHCVVSNNTGDVDITICGVTTGATACNVNSTAPCTGNNQTVYPINFPLDHLVEHFCVYSGLTFSITNNDPNNAAVFQLQCSGNGSPININIPGGGTEWYDLSSCAASQCN